MIKQVIVIRKDLNMRKGKMCAQAAHASMKVFFDRKHFYKYKDSAEDDYEVDEDYCEFYISPEEKEWIEGLFTKVVVGCNSEIELLFLYNKAVAQQIPCALITDAGLTEFHGKATTTAIAIGPAKSETIDKITGYLKLL